MASLEAKWVFLFFRVTLICSHPLSLLHFLAMPMGQMPVLEVDGKRVHQSISMARFLAKTVGLSGTTPWEDLQIDIVVDTINDFRLSTEQCVKLHVICCLINLCILIYRNCSRFLRTRRWNQGKEIGHTEQWSHSILFGETGANR